MNTIWMLERADERDGHNGSYWEETLDADEGFFLTREAAEARIAALDGLAVDAYNQYVLSVLSENEKRRVEYKSALADFEMLVAGGRMARPPRQLPLQEPLPFKVWRARHWPVRHSPLEVRDGSTAACPECRQAGAHKMGCSAGRERA